LVTVLLTGRDLTVDEVVRVARNGEKVELADVALDRMRESREVVEAAIARGDPVYGLTTGVGAKKSAAVSAAEMEQHNGLLVLNHRVGQGAPLPSDVVRAALVRLANHLASGAPGVRPVLAQAFVEALDGGAVPVVRSLGSIGMGDLSANADLVHGVLGGIRLAGGEGMALLNHNAVSTGHAALALTDARSLVAAIDLSAALDLEAFGANVSMLDSEIGRVRPYPGVIETIESVRAALEGSFLFELGAARNLQDPLCFRCIPQVHGAARDALRFALDQLAVELNAHQANPLVVAGERPRILSVGNFDVLPVASSLDFVRIALAPVLTCASERTVKLLQRPLSDLPEGLAGDYGIADDGLAEFGIAVQSIVSEARLLAQPVSFELSSATQAEGIEDRATSAPLAARRLAEQVALGARVAAIELVVAAQAVDLRGSHPLGVQTAALHTRVRELVPPMTTGDPIPQDLEPVVTLVSSGLSGTAL
jgi:histidine ammonia-lyase